MKPFSLPTLGCAGPWVSAARWPRLVLLALIVSLVGPRALSGVPGGALLATEQAASAQDRPAQDRPAEVAQPADDPPALTMPKVITAPPTNVDDPDLRKKIQELIENPAQMDETGDPILDGIIDSLRARGSVLEGSSLDPLAGPDPASPPVHQRTAPGAPSEADYRMAEQLLKTARMLATMEEDPDDERRMLIARLREEARRCLNAAPKNPRTFGPAPGTTPTF